MYHHDSNILDVFIFAFSNAILLGCVRAKSMMNNLILRTEKRRHFSHITRHYQYEAHE